MQENINIIQKECSKCKEYKLLKEFHVEKSSKYGRNARCKKCIKEYSDKHYFLNKEGIISNKNKDKIRNYQKFYYKNKKQTDHLYRFKSNLRTLLCSSFKRNNKKLKKSSKCEKILGCSLIEFSNYIQQKFSKGMTFENYGKWHLDHIIPISLAKTEEEVVKLNHYTNFQPLWAKDNIQKSNKII